jgi:hypothetical protein
MDKIKYLEMLPLNGITKYKKGQPNDGIPFSGYPRAHPSEKNKLLLVNDPLGPEPVVLEFRLEDILYVEEIPSAVTEAGEGVLLVKLWVKRGSVGMILEPFEVNDPGVERNSEFAGKIQAARERLANCRAQDNL